MVGENKKQTSIRGIVRVKEWGKVQKSSMKSWWLSRLKKTQKNKKGVKSMLGFINIVKTILNSGRNIPSIKCNLSDFSSTLLSSTIYYSSGVPKWNEKDEFAQEDE